MITFKYESFQKEVQIKYETDRTVLGDIIEDFKAFLLAVGYSATTINQYLGEDE